MEVFGQVVAVVLWSQGLAVSAGVKFPVKRETGMAAYGYDEYLIGARGDRLVLATVKSFFDSRGVAAEHVPGDMKRERHHGLFQLLHNCDLREQVVRAAALQYGYEPDQVELRLYAALRAGGDGLANKN